MLGGGDTGGGAGRGGGGGQGHLHQLSARYVGPFNAVPDPTFKFNVHPVPFPHQSDAKLQHYEHSFTAPPCLHFRSLQLLNFDADPDPQPWQGPEISFLCQLGSVAYFPQRQETKRELAEFNILFI